MGEYRDERNIRCFTPDNTEDTLYMRSFDGALDLEDIVEAARSHFGASTPLEEIKITAEHIQTECLGSDAYYPSDWDNFIVLTKQSTSTA